MDNDGAEQLQSIAPSRSWASYGSVQRRLITWRRSVGLRTGAIVGSLTTAPGFPAGSVCHLSGKIDASDRQHTLHLIASLGREINLMSDKHPDCAICQGTVGDAELQRIQVWEDNLWRLTISLEAEILAFAYLEPKRHIPDITALDGEEACTFGETLALC